MKGFKLLKLSESLRFYRNKKREEEVERIKQ